MTDNTRHNTSLSVADIEQLTTDRRTFHQHPELKYEEHFTAGLVADRLKQYIATTPAVSVSVKELNSYSIFVLGEVAKPGKYPLKSYVTVLQAISMAGGFTDYAKKNKLQVVRVTENGDHRRQEVHIPLRYDDLVAGRGEPGNIVLHSGDTVLVP